MEILLSPPEPSAFIPLAEHQSRTPESFYSGPPILHYLSERCKVVILERELRDSAALRGLHGAGIQPRASNGESANTSSTSRGDDGNADLEKNVIMDGVDVWVTSECVGFYSLRIGQRMKRG
jgi:nucleotide-sensitive chloride channel 1A